MISRSKLPIAVTVLALLFSATVAQADGPRQDAKAIEVLQRMAAYKTTLDQVVIEGVAYTDARLGAGLMVSNSEEVEVSINRPGSMLINRFDGESNKGLYFHEGLLTVFSSAKMLFAQATVPNEIDAAMAFALEEFGVEAPLMDLLYQDASIHLISSDESILYLTDKSRVAGKDCHQIAIRGPETDIQLWVEEGDQPLPLKIMITSKWEGGSPRFVANLHWKTDQEFSPGLFEFKAPEGAMKVNFVTEPLAQ
ncbi:MAG: DUF2092 domain-containing protein [Arenicella sp.]|nr:DUF2092 domain-containing protein [Arenicella sp.]